MRFWMISCCTYVKYLSKNVVLESQEQTDFNTTDLELVILIIVYQMTQEK